MNKPDFGSGELEFAHWETPFENADVEVMEVAYGFGSSSTPGVWEDDDRRRWLDRSLFRAPFEARLVIRVLLLQSDSVVARYHEDPVYRVSFDEVSAFRVLDECGLLELWGHDRPSQCTFRVRNHLWAKESMLSFFHGTDDGWSFVIATDGVCVEVVARTPPEITLEDGR